MHFPGSVQMSMPKRSVSIVSICEIFYTYFNFCDLLNFAYRRGISGDGVRFRFRAAWHTNAGLSRLVEEL
jgi:hypothetical protein